MELRHLRYFIAVAETLNFSRAAEHLHIAQPPLSQQIRALEDELGVQLFDRKKRPLQLTDAGVVFLEEARLALAQVERAVISAQRASRGEIGRLALGFNSAIANSVLLEILRSFRHRFPEVELVLHELASYQQAQELHNRQIDVGFVYLPNINDDTLSFMSLLQESLVIVLPETHPLSAQTQIQLQDLKDERFVLPKPNLVPGLYSQIVNLCQQVGFFPKVAHEAVWMLTVLSLVASGAGIALLPATAQNLHYAGVVYRTIQGQTANLQMAMVWRRNDSSAVLHKFLEVARDVTKIP